MQIKEGRYYRNRGGRIVGPARLSSSPDYPWQVGNLTFHANGFFYPYPDASSQDLIEEVTLVERIKRFFRL
jgi:hypothetical protein